MSENKLKELKNDAILDIKINKAYYFMVKLELFKVLDAYIQKHSEDKAKELTNIVSKKYEELDEEQKTIFVFSLLLAEIERVAEENNLFELVDPKDIIPDLD
jgi:translation initiation factor 2B subunit (eIF-2B alpha/beta/delta family)